MAEETAYSIFQHQLEAICIQFTDELKELTTRHQIELQEREKKLRKIMAENDIQEVDLMEEELEQADYNEVKEDIAFKWDEILGAGIDNILKRNQKILTEGFGVPKELVSKIFKEKEIKPPHSKCPVLGCENSFTIRV